jgi:hypothetical protein
MGSHLFLVLVLSVQIVVVVAAGHGGRAGPSVVILFRRVAWDRDRDGFRAGVERSAKKGR